MGLCILRRVDAGFVSAVRIDRCILPRGSSLRAAKTARDRVVNTDKCPGPVSNLKVASETLVGPDRGRLGARKCLEDAMSEFFMGS